MSNAMYHIGRKVLRAVSESSPDVAATAFQQDFVYQAINSAKDDILADLIETYERFRIGSPTDINLQAGVSRYALPVGCLRITMVQVNLGSGDYFIIRERKTGQQHADEQYPLDNEAIGIDTVYQIMGDKELLYIELQPPPATDMTAGLRVYHERDIPDLFDFYPAQASGASTLYLPNSYNDSVGQQEADPVDAVYAGLQAHVISGTGAGDLRRISTYTGSTRLAAMDSAWSANPTTGSVVSLVMPFTRPLIGAIVYYAAAELAANSGEDGRSLMARYERRLEKWIDALDTLTPSHGQVIPFDLESDLWD